MDKKRSKASVWRWYTGNKVKTDATATTQLIAALRRAAEADRMIKGLADGDAWDALLQLGFSLIAPPQGGIAPGIRGKISGTIRG